MATEYRDIGGRGEEGYPVRSRVSWGAIIAGAAVAIASYVLLNLLGLAIGLSVGGQAGQIGTPTAIWMILASLISLFLGGWVTTQCTTGESRMEAIFYGVVLWGVLFTLLAWMASEGVRLGLNALVDLGAGERAAGFRPEAAPADVQQQRENMTTAAWWAFLGTLLSIGAAILGALAGARAPRIIGERRAGSPPPGSPPRASA